MTTQFFYLPCIGAFAALLMTSCLTQRTVTDGTGTVEQGLVIKRPVKELMENSR